MDDYQNLVLYEDDFYEKKEVKEKSLELVAFRIASEWYAVDIASVREVVTFDKITPLPSLPEHIAGIINLRGNIISVTDLRKLFGLGTEELTRKSRLVVVKAGTLETALLTDEVAEPLQVSATSIEATMTTMALDRADYLSGTCNIDRRFIGILRIDKVLQVQAKA